MTFISLIIVVVLYFVINFILGTFYKQVAYAKGYDDKAHAFILVFIFGIFGCLYVVALPDLVLRKQNERKIAVVEYRAGLRGNPDAEEEIPEIPEITE